MSFINRIREKYNLEENFDYEIIADKESFNKKFKTLTAETYYSSIFAFLDIFVASHKKYIGTVNENEIVLRERIRPFNLTLTSYKVEMEINQANQKLEIKTSILSPSTFSLILRILFIILFSLLGVMILIESILSKSFSTIFILLILAIVTIYIPYLMTISKIKKVKEELIEVYTEIDK